MNSMEKRFSRICARNLGGRHNATHDDFGQSGGHRWGYIAIDFAVGWTRHYLVSGSSGPRLNMIQSQWLRLIQHLFNTSTLQWYSMNIFGWKLRCCGADSIRSHVLPPRKDSIGQFLCLFRLKFVWLWNFLEGVKHRHHEIQWIHRELFTQFDVFWLLESPGNPDFLALFGLSGRCPQLEFSSRCAAGGKKTPIGQVWKTLAHKIWWILRTCFELT